MVGLLKTRHFNRNFLFEMQVLNIFFQVSTIKFNASNKINLTQTKNSFFHIFLLVMIILQFF